MKKRSLIIITSIAIFSVCIILFLDTGVYARSKSSEKKEAASPIIPPKPVISGEGSGEAEFKYDQKPIKKAKKKNVKIRVTISTFEDDLEIEDSFFNIKEDEEKEPTEAAIDIKDSDVRITMDKEEIEEEELSKKELLTGLIADALTKTQAFEVVERREINELIREINFQNSKWVKKDNVNTIGNIFGVQYIVTGDILRSEDREKIGRDYYTLAIRMYNVNTAEIVSSSVSNRPYLKNAVHEAVADLAEQVKSKAWSCRVVGADDSGAYVNAGLKDGIEEEDTFYVYRIGDEIKDPETKEVLGVKRNKIATIGIEEVLDEYLSKIKVVEKIEEIRIGDVVLAERFDKKSASELNLWREIYGAKDDQDISGQELDRYSLASYNFSPEDIMENFGRAVVKIQTDIGIGSGFVVNIDGSVVTNFHVVQNAQFVNVKMIEQDQYFTNVQVIKVNPARDIALLKINNAEDLPFVVLGDSDNIKIGERVIAIGNPEGLENTISDGLISGVRETDEVKLIQTSVPITHGSSGGPLLNMDGEVIGIVTAGKGEGNLNFAVPINYVKEELL